MRNWTMPSPAKLRIQSKGEKGKKSKARYWYTDAGGTGTYFGRVGDVTHKDAERLFREHMASLASTKPKAGALSAATLFDEFLDAVLAHRSKRTYEERKLHLDRFANYRSGTNL